MHPWLSLFVQAKKLLNFLPKQVPSVPINCYAQKDKMFNATGIFAKYLMRQSLGNSPVGLLQECKNRCRSRSSVTMVSLASQDVRTVIKQMTFRLRKKYLSVRVQVLLTLWIDDKCPTERKSCPLNVCLVRINLPRPIPSRCRNASLQIWIPWQNAGSQRYQNTWPKTSDLVH